MSTNGRSARRMGAGVIFTICVLSLATLWTLLVEGPDFMDEGCGILAARHPDDGFYIPFSSAHRYAGILLSLAGGNVAGMRRMGLVLLASSAVFLAVSVWRAVRRNYPVPRDSEAVVVVAAATCSAVLFRYVLVPPYEAFTTLPATPNYNLFNSVLLNVSVGCFANMLAEDDQRRSVRAAVWNFVLGVFVGMQMVIRWPTAVLMAPIFIALCWLSGDAPHRRRIHRAALVPCGLVIWLAVHFTTLDHFGDWWAKSRALLHYVGILSNTHGFGAIIPQVRSLAFAFAAVIGIAALPVAIAVDRPFVPPGSSGRAVLVSLRRFARLLFQEGEPATEATSSVEPLISPRRFAFAAAALLAGQVLSLAFHFQTRQLVLQIAAFGSSMVLYGCVLFRHELIAGGARSDARPNVLRLLALLAWLPLLGPFGTGAPVAWAMSMYLAPWATLTWILGTRALGPSRPLAPACVSALFLAPVLLQLHNAGIRQRILPLIAPQPVEAPGTHWNGLALRPAEAEVVTTLRSAALAHGFHDGGDVISLYDMPWLVDAIGGVSPGVPWYYGAFPGSVASAAYVLGTLPRDRLRKACFLTRSKATHELPDLHALGVPFPEEYDLLASVTWPRTGDVVRLWAPSAR